MDQRKWAKPNKGAAPNAGGRRQFPLHTALAARVGALTVVRPMRAPSFIRLTITIISAAALLAGLLLSFIAVIFFGNFNFVNNAHIGIFASTIFASVFVAAS